MKATAVFGTAATALILAAPALQAQQRPAGAARTAGPAAAASLQDIVFDALEWRSIGPANFAGRISDVEGIPHPSATFYIAPAAGGVWKTTNNGTTFRPVFDGHPVASMGDIAIAPSDTLQVWAGTGEESLRNSISPGRGIYKSVDGGTSWQLMGLEKTETIGRIVVHPTNPDIVYVAASGAIWRTNPERGLYKTTDGGRTWQLVKFINDRTGFVDVAMDPGNPDVLYAASWERQRGPYYLQSGGPGSGLWKSTDAGRTWTEIRGNGFPETHKGRIGLAIAHSNPNVVYALVEAESPDGVEGGCRQSKPGGCGLYRSQDAGRSWEWMNGNNVRPFYYSQVRVDPSNPDRVYWSSTPVNVSNDGGRTVMNATVGIHVDHHAMWIDPKHPSRMVVGNDGGIGISWDQGGTYIFPNQLPLGQFYAVSYDMAVPYRVCGGLQDNYTWCGPSRRARGGVTNAMWFSINGGDGFYTAQDPRDPNIIYGESQGGNMMRIDIATGVSTRLGRPDWREPYRMWRDSAVLARGDESRPATPEVERRVAEFRRRQLEDSAGYQVRYNWNTPFLLSPHNPDVFYAGTNRVLKSTNRGDVLIPISPDLSKQDSMKLRISTRTTGGITRDATGAETYGTIVALTESPLRRGLLYAGTDDGNVWLSPDDGATWQDLTPRFRGLVPDTTYVSRIEASRHDANSFYVAFDGHRTGDFTPYVFITTDGGRTFRSIARGLPTGGIDFVHVIREDPTTPNLLYVGTDLGVHVSLDRGQSWRPFMKSLPQVPVHDLQVHPRDRELIAGTHGRSIWIVDVAPLQQLAARQFAAGAPALFEPAPALQHTDVRVEGQYTGHMVFESPGVVYGGHIVYYSHGSEQPAVLTITDRAGEVVQTLRAPGAAGLHRVAWNMRGQAPPRAPLSPSELRDSIADALRIRTVADSLVAAGQAAARRRSRLMPHRQRPRRAPAWPLYADAPRRPASGGGAGLNFRAAESWIVPRRACRAALREPDPEPVACRVHPFGIVAGGAPRCRTGACVRSAGFRVVAGRQHRSGSTTLPPRQDPDRGVLLAARTAQQHDTGDAQSVDRTVSNPAAWQPRAVESGLQHRGGSQRPDRRPERPRSAIQHPHGIDSRNEPSAAARPRN
jgi:hypothetical protein